jgi:hypothetical protein
MTLKALEPTSRRTVLSMKEKGWIEPGVEAGTYLITAAGDAAMRSQMPLRSVK